MSGDCAIIPVRKFGATKLRLKDVLSDEKRIALTAALLKRVMSALEQSLVEYVVVVASEPSEVSSLLGNNSKLCIIQEESYHGGVNKAMRSGIDFAINKGAKTVLLLPSDLPLITPSKIDDSLNLMGKYELVINPSIKKDGTNLLAMKSSLQFELHYDDDSFVKHFNEAVSIDLNFLTLDWQEFSNDLDDAEDLERIMKIYNSKSFDEFQKRISEVG